MSEQTIKNLTEQRDEFLNALETLKKAAIKRHQIGAEWCFDVHREVFAELKEALTLCDAAIEKVKQENALQRLSNLSKEIGEEL